MKTKEIKKMSKEERMKKMEELKFELIKARSGKTGSSKIKEIKKTIARILTFNNQEKPKAEKAPVKKVAEKKKSLETKPQRKLKKK